MSTATAARQARVQTQREQEDNWPSVVLVDGDHGVLSTAQPGDHDVAAAAPVRRGVVLTPEVWEIPRAEASTMTIQRWEGVVLACSSNTFTARIVDVQRGHPDEEVVLAYDEISPFDQEMVAEGAIFYWGVGYRQRLPNGSRERVSRIRFRRLPAWTRAEVDEQLERARVLAENLGWE